MLGKQHVTFCLGLALVAIPVQAQEWMKAASLSPTPKLPVSALAQLGRFSGPDVSPDGKRIAFLSAINGRNHVVIKPLDPALGAAAVLAPSLPAYEYRWVKWANSERVLVGLGTQWSRAYSTFDNTSFDTRSRETRLISVRYDGKNVVNMFKPKKSDRVGSRFGEVTNMTNVKNQDNVIHTTPADPDTFLLSAYEDYSTDVGASIRKVDVATGSYKIIQVARSNIHGFETDLAATPRLGWGANYSGNMSLPFLAYKSPDGDGWVNFDKSLLLLDEVTFVGFMPDPHFAYVLAPMDGRRSLVKFDMVQQKITSTLYRDSYSDVENVYRDETGNVIGVEMAGTKKRDVLLDPVWEKRFSGLAKALPNQRLSIVSISNDGKFMVLHGASATEPGIYFLYEVGKKTLEPLEYDYAGLGPDNAAYRQSVTYRARDGLDIEAFLTLPRGVQPKNLPTVILPHGGPWANDDITYDWWSQFLANRGYAVLQPNFRGSTGYGQAFMDKGNGQWGLTMQDDLTDGVAWLVKNTVTDKNRVCIVGGSYGGYAALMAAVKTPDVFKCASSLNGVSDILQLLGDDNGRFKSEQTSRMIGDRDKDRARLRETSPINSVDRIRIPIQLVHAKNDLRVDIKQSQRMRDKLQAAGKAVEYVEIERGEHWLENEPARLTYLTALEAFLSKHLGP
jgi:acetyl esterase/lipase